ncbi:NADPH:quinone oxidoreductase family protein [Sphingomonas colocasiae]|uniref:NADPH:quinone oxidoreductase family protein n=1 Tax=Sphingomonas colocasiae TaxID=1848973 RepID=A0ABS7PSN0_9SPHN|nr:NADPH:quinone oxidoreductase family protein [Sphingomonas colocasiae]MBY8824347.1 NADPH:quinone oxidoreductase family protein [Sphingomonas colocasiae]
MRAVICRDYGGPELLEIGMLPDPVPTNGEVLIRVHASSINFPDALNIQGRYQVKRPLPFVAGSEVAGVIEAIGPDVSSIAVGDRVAAVTQVGGFAEKAIAAASAAIKLPDDIPFEFAATFSVTYGTAYLGLVEQAKLRAGETLLVLGAAGGVGIAAIEIAKAMGATVIAAASSPEKRAAASAAGADHLIGYDDIKDQTRALTGGLGANVVFDPVGDRFAEPALRAMGWQGRYLVIGFAAGDIPRIPLNLLLLKSGSAIGVFFGEWASRNPAAAASHAEALFDLYRRGALTAQIGGRFPLEGVPDALVQIMERRAVGKLLIEM